MSQRSGGLPSSWRRLEKRPGGMNPENAVGGILKRTVNCALNLWQFRAGFSHLANHPKGSSIAAVNLQFEPSGDVHS